MLAVSAQSPAAYVLLLLMETSEGSPDMALTIHDRDVYTEVLQNIQTMHNASFCVMFEAFYFSSSFYSWIDI